MDWSDITIGRDEADFPRLLTQWWSWILHEPYRPILMTAFGDWFLMDEMGKAHLLDLLEGALTPVADSVADLNRLMQSADNRDQWFLPGFIISMQRAGVPRPAGQCYAYRIHPILGGELASSNLMLLDIEVWQAICSQIHQQVRDIKVANPDARIKGMEFLGGWTIRLTTA